MEPIARPQPLIIYGVNITNMVRDHAKKTTCLEVDQHIAKESMYDNARAFTARVLPEHAGALPDIFASKELSDALELVAIQKDLRADDNAMHELGKLTKRSAIAQGLALITEAKLLESKGLTLKGTRSTLYGDATYDYDRVIGFIVRASYPWTPSVMSVNTLEGAGIAKAEFENALLSTLSYAFKMKEDEIRPYLKEMAVNPYPHPTTNASLSNPMAAFEAAICSGA